MYLISRDNFQNVWSRKSLIYVIRFSIFYYIFLKLELCSEQRSSELAFLKTPGKMNLLKITFLLICPL